jgi:TolA-binding protein
MRSASNAPELLGDYARAVLYNFRGMTDSTEVQYEKLVNADNKALADLALYRLSELQLGEADSAAALQSIDLLQKGFPDSYYLPLGLKTKADMLARTEDGIDQAKAIYKLLLEQYADYPFTSEVRETLRKIESHVAS